MKSFSFPFILLFFLFFRLHCVFSFPVLLLPFSDRSLIHSSLSLLSSSLDPSLFHFLLTFSAFSSSLLRVIFSLSGFLCLFFLSYPSFGAIPSWLLLNETPFERMVWRFSHGVSASSCCYEALLAETQSMMTVFRLCQLALHSLSSLEILLVCVLLIY